jgi:hypothetical protein
LLPREVGKSSWISEANPVFWVAWIMPAPFVNAFEMAFDMSNEPALTETVPPAPPTAPFPTPPTPPVD